MELIKEFKASRSIENCPILFSENDAKQDKISMAFLSSFDRFANTVTSFLKNHREVNRILILNSLKKMKGNLFFI